MIARAWVQVRASREACVSFHSRIAGCGARVCRVDRAGPGFLGELDARGIEAGLGGELEAAATRVLVETVGEGGSNTATSECRCRGKRRRKRRRRQRRGGWYYRGEERRERCRLGRRRGRCDSNGRRSETSSNAKKREGKLETERSAYLGDLCACVARATPTALRARDPAVRSRRRRRRRRLVPAVKFQRRRDGARLGVPRRWVFPPSPAAIAADAAAAPYAVGLLLHTKMPLLMS